MMTILNLMYIINHVFLTQLLILFRTNKINYNLFDSIFQILLLYKYYVFQPATFQTRSVTASQLACDSPLQNVSEKSGELEIILW